MGGQAGGATPGSGAMCVVLTGANGMFSAGYDISEIPEQEFEERAQRLVAHPFTDAIGVPRTRELFLLGRYIDAPTALAWGLVNRVVGAAELDAVTLELGAELAGNAPLAQRGNKRVIAALLGAEGELASDVEEELIALRRASFASQDMREGMRAFAEKRAPRWRNG